MVECLGEAQLAAEERKFYCQQRRVVETGVNFAIERCELTVVPRGIELVDECGGCQSGFEHSRLPCVGVDCRSGNIENVVVVAVAHDGYTICASETCTAVVGGTVEVCPIAFDWIGR